MEGRAATKPFFPAPDYFGYVSQAVTELPEYYRNEPSDGTITELMRYAHVTWTDAGITLISALFWTICRSLFGRAIVKPIGRALELSETSQSKLPEYAWRLVFHILSWSYVAYVLVFNYYDILNEPPLCALVWSPGVEVPTDIKLAYYIQGGYYIHALLAIMVLDVWRKDSWVMCAHHILTLLLITLSYAVRYHYLGLMVVLYHDFSDIFLDLSKCNIYLRDRGKRQVDIYQQFANISFAIFTLAWCATRMYLFPMKILYSILPSVGLAYIDVHVPLLFEFNILLITLMCMNIYWFGFILLLIYKIVTKQLPELGDIRDKKNSVDEPATHSVNGKAATTNGHAHHSNGTTNSHTNGVTKEKAFTSDNGVTHRRTQQT